jgi:hypothetical protein
MAWAVGRGPKALILQWNGKVWRTDKTPHISPASGLSYLGAVTGLSAGQAWAVGGACSACASDESRYRTLAVRWNGSKWSTVKTPNPSEGWDYLADISAISPTTAFAVGTECATGCPAARMLILGWNGKSWSTR